MEIQSNENKVMLIFIAVVLLMPIWLMPFGASYPDFIAKVCDLWNLRNWFQYFCLV